jgi:DNA modification methylase
VVLQRATHVPFANENEMKTRPDAVAMTSDGREIAVEIKSRKLDIATNRICDCEPSHINCLTAKEWIKCQLGVWQFYYEGRDIRDKAKHPATFPIALARRCIDLFSHQGELVVDPFMGSGTTLVAARDANRNAVGFDIHLDYIALTKERLRQESLFTETQQFPILDDARNIAQYLEEESIACIVTSPPYANLLNRKRLNKSRRGSERKNEQYKKVEQYSQRSEDLGTLDLDAYSKAMAEIFASLLPLLKKKGHCVINVPDMWWENKRITIHVSVIEALRSVGFELRNTIIWDRTNIVNNIGIFGWPSNYITMGTTFEYLLDFWRPEKATILVEKPDEAPEVDTSHTDRSENEIATMLNGKAHSRPGREKEKAETFLTSSADIEAGKEE